MRGLSLSSLMPFLLFVRHFSLATPTAAAQSSTFASPAFLTKNRRYKLKQNVLPEQIWKRLLDEQGGDYQLYDDNGVNEKCSEYLIGFLEGTTDAKDTCEGISNAYLGANCETVSFYEADDDQDDYFGEFYEHKCCQSLLSLHSEYCDENSLLTNINLLVVSTALLLCEVAKSLVKRHNILFLPEAAVCILVGIVLGILAHIIPGADIDSVSFDEQLFLAVLLPPIIFEAALTVSKEHFRRRRLAISMFAIFGTLMSTVVTGSIVHFSSKYLPTTTIPMLDSMIYGALISSIDPVAILSVLTSLNLDQTDTVFILLFGESLLNDGVAITVTHVLVDRFGEGNLSFDEILEAVADFLIVGVGSISIGFFCSLLCLVYFWLFRRLLNPGMEVGSFFLWALVPYWVCDGFGWSGIVAIVTAGFFMDIYIASNRKVTEVEVVHNSDSSLAPAPASPGSVVARTPRSRPGDSPSSSGHGQIYSSMSDENVHPFSDQFSEQGNSCNPRTLAKLNIWDLLHKNEKVRLSREADKHVRFVAHLMAQLSENSIFVYLGLFLFSQNYDWDIALVTIGVFSCIAARALMVVTCCNIIWHINVLRGRIPTCGYGSNRGISRTAMNLNDKGTQMVLIFAGLRGAVSLALVENVPIFNNVTGEGCEFKPVLKAMTSAAIIFTMFVLGGSAYYIFPFLGIGPDDASSTTASQAESTTIKRTDTEMSSYRGYKEPDEIPFPRPPQVV